MGVMTYVVAALVVLYVVRVLTNHLFAKGEASIYAKAERREQVRKRQSDR